MKSSTTKFLLTLFFLILSQNIANAEVIRAYCAQNKVIFEQRDDQLFTDDNKLFQYDTVLVDQKNISSTNRDQLRCQNGTIIIDTSLLSSETIKKEKIRELATQLDAELGKAEPDVITVLRLQRAIEKIKE